MSDLTGFVRESNRIEGITREPTDAEVVAHDCFWKLPRLTVGDVEALVSILQPGAVLRDVIGRDVRVGNYYPPRGSPDIRRQLTHMLAEIGQHTPYTFHQRYEALHPFTDGNGRSGRAIWLWMVGGSPPLGFLHHWYYMSLKEGAK